MTWWAWLALSLGIALELLLVAAMCAVAALADEETRLP